METCHSVKERSLTDQLVNLCHTMRSLILLVLVGAVTAGLAPLQRAKVNKKGSYIIKFKDDLDVDSVADDIQRRVHQRRIGRATLSHRYSKVLKGVAMELSEAALDYIRSLDEVECVSEDGVAQADQQWTGIAWGLDRIDQRNLPLDQQFSTLPAYKEGEGVDIWVLDTGILPTHVEFVGRVSIEFDAFANANAADYGVDCNGHGTHCAGVTAGTIFGVAKKAKVKAVKVLGSEPCNKNAPHSAIIQGLDYVAMNALKPTVVSMSLSSQRNDMFDAAVKSLVNDHGIPVVVSAGNDNANACRLSPCWLSEVITVGSSTKDDVRRFDSNYGSCVDIFAPGDNIPSAYHTSDSAWASMSGTSMACPNVAGIAALYLGENPNLTPSEIKQKLQDNATKDKLTGIQSGSPNLLAYVQPK